MTKLRHHYPISARKSNNKIKKWFFKWDRAIAAITAVLVFFALLSLVIFNITTESADDDDDSDQGDNPDTVILSKTGVSLSSRPSCEANGDSTIQCTSGSGTLLVQAINDAIPDTYQEKINLVLGDTSFDNNKINNGWLNGIKRDLSSLRIQGTNLKELGAEVFGGDPFENMAELIFDNTNIKIYQKNSFKNAVNIKRLYIRYNDKTTGVTMEEDCFGFLAATLAELQVLHCIYSNELLINITGSKATRLDALVMLDIRYNSIGSLTAESFSNAPSLSVLYASSAGINNTPEPPFAKQTFQILDIRSNSLTFLPPNTFTAKNVGASAIMFSAGNFWNCNCSLLWLKHFFESYNDRFSDKTFLCMTESGAQVPYTNVSFCDEDGAPTASIPTTSSRFPAGTSTPGPTASIPTTSSVTSTPTDSSNTITSNPPSYENTFNLTCKKAVEQLDSNIGEDDWITLRKETVKISFLITSETTQEYIYELTITGSLSKNDNLLVLKNSDSFPTQECISNIIYNQTKTTLSLTPSKTYTYCLLKNNNNLMVDPLDCKSLSTPALWGNQSFIPNNAKLYWIIGISVTLLLAVSITCLISFFCIRQHPEWIKSNNRVVIIKEDKAGTRILASPYYDQVPYVPPSLSLQSDNSYLVPTNRNIYHGSSIGSIRTISQNISIAGPSHIDSYNRYRIRKPNKRRNRIHSDPTDDNLYESPPPPLPPNHPNFNRNPSSLQYSRV